MQKTVAYCNNFIIKYIIMQKLHVKNLTKEMIESNNLFSIVGDDYYFIDKAVKMFTSLIEDDFKEFNLSVIDNLTTLEQLSSAIGRYPSFSDVTVVILRDKEKKKEFDKNEISSIVLNAPKWCKVVGVNSGTLSANDSLSMLTVSAEKLNKNEIREEIKSMFMPKGITQSAVEKLSYYTNCDMGRIEMEANKLLCFAPDRMINEDDVDLLVVPDDEHRIYEFTNAALNLNILEAKRLLDRLIKQGEDKTYILSSLISQYRRLFYAMCSKESDAKVGDMLGIKEYAAMKLRETAKKHKPIELRKTLNSLIDLEYKIRCGDLSVETGFSMAQNVMFSQK